LDRTNLARSIELELLAGEASPLADLGPLRGSGIYAIYYAGTLEMYRPTTNVPPDFRRPIYVGKAIPKGSRKGGLAENKPKGNPLGERLKKHARSIEGTVNLDVGDFYVRHLQVEDIWIPLGENVMIERFRPTWNLAVEGFGNNVPGGGRNDQKLSPWDVLHPGRKLAEGLGKTPVSQEFMIQRVTDFLAERPMSPLPRAVKQRLAIADALEDAGFDGEVE
jgi:hypothetical protein